MRFTRKPSRRPTPARRPPAALRPKVYLYEGELRRLGAHVVDRRTLETGGELYGLLTHSGSLVVSIVTGPGPSARHRSMSFHQDGDALRAAFAHLQSRHGLQHIGTWHSHHGLSLAEPSGGDDATMEVALQSSGLPGFVMMLANLVGARGRPSHDGEPELRVYLYEASAPRTAVSCEVSILPGECPIRVHDFRLRALDTLPAKLPRDVDVHGVVDVGRPADLARSDPASALSAATWTSTPQGRQVLQRLHRELTPTGLFACAEGRLELRLQHGALHLGGLDMGIVDAEVDHDGTTFDLSGDIETLAERVSDVIASHARVDGVRTHRVGALEERDVDPTDPPPGEESKP